MIHLLKERKSGGEITAKCGYRTKESAEATIWWRDVTCTECQPVFIGQRREFVKRSRRDPHTVLRFNALTDEVYIKFSDKTTEWHETRLYLSETQPCGDS